jgi:lysophospholipase L1-like esterase
MVLGSWLSVAATLPDAGGPVMRSWHVLGVLLVGVLALTYVSVHAAGTAPATTTPIHRSTAPRAVPAPRTFVPSRMAATGDSVTVGFLTCFHRTCPDNSWSTGTSIDSHYERIRAVNPKIAGHARNFAQLGAYSWNLVAQAEKAVRFKAQYVTVLIGANDACTRNVRDMTRVIDFRRWIDDALDVLTAGLPEARILVVSIPDIYRLWRLGHDSLFALLSWTVLPGCRSMMVNPRSTAAADTGRRQRVAAQIRAYNRQLAAACKAHGPHCRWDGYAANRVPFSMDLVDPLDHFHPNLKGQARLAAVTYPGNFDW